jgi:hypothetical protein
MPWMGIWVRWYTVVPLWSGGQGVAFWNMGIRPSLNDVDVGMLWLLLQTTLNCILHPYHLEYAKNIKSSE